MLSQQEAVMMGQSGEACAQSGLHGGLLWSGWSHMEVVTGGR